MFTHQQCFKKMQVERKSLQEKWWIFLFVHRQRSSNISHKTKIATAASKFKFEDQNKLNMDTTSYALQFRQTGEVNRRTQHRKVDKQEPFRNTAETQLNLSQKIKGFAIHWLTIHTLWKISNFCSLDYDFHSLCRAKKTPTYFELYSSPLLYLKQALRQKARGNSDTTGHSSGCRTNAPKTLFAQ